MQAVASLRHIASKRPGVAGAVLAALLLGACGGLGDSAREARRALQEGRAQDGWTLAGQAIGADSSSVDAWIQRARAGLRTFRTKEGMAAAERAVALDSARADAYLVRAYLFQRRFRNVAANASADRAAQLAPADARMHIARGELHLGGGVGGTADYEVANAAFREALRLDRNSPRARFGLARTLVLQAQDEEALPLLDDVIADRPFHGDAFYYRGLVRMRNRDMERAAEDFERAARLLPDPASARFNLARVLDRLGKPEEAAAARADYPQARLRTEEIKSGELTWHETPSLGVGLRLAVGFRHAARFDEAYCLTETLSLDNPNSAASLMELAENAIGAGRHDAAARAALRATELAPAEPRARVLLIMATLAAGDTTTAVAHADAAAQAVNHPEVTLAIAEARRAAGRADEAVRLARELGGNMSADPRVTALLGHALSAAGRHENAARALGNAIAVRPDVAGWLEARGRAYAAAGRPDAAEKDLRAALALDPHRVSCHDALAKLFDAANRRADAKAERAERDRIQAADEKIRALRTKWRERPGDLRLTRQLADELAAAGREGEAGRVWQIAEPEVAEP